MGISTFPGGGGMDFAGKTVQTANLSSSSASLVTVIEVIGEGVASVAIQGGSGATRQARAVLTVDGVAVEDYSNVGLAIDSDFGINVFGAAVPGMTGKWGLVGVTASRVAISGTHWIGFKDSFKYEISTSSGSNVTAVAEVLA